jgi:predicted phosphodiesterase
MSVVMNATPNTDWMATMKILRVGDPHAKVTNIDEMDRLLEFVAAMALEHKVDRIELLGDLFHTHAVLRLEVLELWKHWLDHLSDICELVVLVGNHDMSGDYNSNSSALDIFDLMKKKNLQIVNFAKVLGVFGYVPYIHNNEKFIEAANHLVAYGAKVLVSHTTYQGSKYESGMYAPDGVDPEKLQFDLLISGHVHSRQRFRTNKGQEVIYPGTARWDTNSDANEPKGLWLVEHGPEGGIISEQFLDTSHVCAPIISVELKEGEEMSKYPEGARVTVNLIGSSEWVAKQKATLKGKYSFTAKITDKAKLEHRKSGKSFLDFMTNHFESKNKQKLLDYMKVLEIV